jgi:hypothetical protein
MLFYLKNLTLGGIYNFNVTVSQGAQEIFKLLPHTFVDAEKLPEIFQVLCFYSFSCIKS